jgi:hypothetical protein
MMLCVGVLLYYSTFGVQMVAFFGDATASLVCSMFLLSGIALAAVGLSLLVKKGSVKMVEQPLPGTAQKNAERA